MLDVRYEQNPERFVRGHPTVKLPPDFVAINPISVDEEGDTLADHVNFPTLIAAGYVSGK